jgi:hypothetical protein
MTEVYELKSTNSNKPKILPKHVANVKIYMMTKNGRTEVTNREELEKFPIGSLISYTNKQGDFKQGGYITDYEENHFVFITPDIKTKYRVKYSKVDKMWVGEIDKVSNDIVNLTESKQKKTNYPVKIGDTVVYYAMGQYDQIRFMTTDKYKLMLGWYQYFVEKK